MPLFNNHDLERSGVVANCCMNRERSLSGSNGYPKELGFNPLDVLREKARNGKATWLDLCCGTGRALVEAAETAMSEGITVDVEIVGVDLVRSWSDSAASFPCLRLVEASLSSWEPGEQFDLITCVHGLHYIGDKLGLIARSVSWLTDHGRFIANLDLSNLQVQNCSRSSRIVMDAFRQAGVKYNRRRKLLECIGRKEVGWPFEYLGADDQVGPNYTGQAAVTSHYGRVDR